MNQAGHALVVPTGTRWQLLIGLMQQLNLKSFVEVGCKEGRVTGKILEAIPEATVIAIDPWMAQPEKRTSVEDFKRGRETYEGPDWDFEKIEAKFWENVGAHKERCTMLRTTSLEAAAELQDRTFDLVFIDALHDYDSVKADIAAWAPLVRPGGVLSGHDFNHRWPGVERAVAEAFDLMQVAVGPDSVWFVVDPNG